MLHKVYASRYHHQVALIGLVFPFCRLYPPDNTLQKSGTLFIFLDIPLRYMYLQWISLIGKVYHSPATCRVAMHHLPLVGRSSLLGLLAVVISRPRQLTCT